MTKIKKVTEYFVQRALIQSTEGWGQIIFPQIHEKTIPAQPRVFLDMYFGLIEEWIWLVFILLYFLTTTTLFNSEAGA